MTRTLLMWQNWTVMAGLLVYFIQHRPKILLHNLDFFISALLGC